MAVPIADIVQRASRHILMDQGGKVWPTAEITEWIHEAQRDIVLRVPGATAKSMTLRCVAGPRQKIPADGARLLVVQGNTPDANTGAPIIVPTGQRTGMNSYAMHVEAFPRHFVLREYYAEYSRPRQDAEQFQFYVWEVKTPLYFWLYPSPQAGDQVDIVYSAVPDTSSGATNLGIPDYYSPVVLDYVLSRVYAKEVSDRADINKAQSYLQRYEKGITDKLRADEYVVPSMRANLTNATET